MRSKSLTRTRPWWAVDAIPWGWSLLWESSELSTFTNSTKEQMCIWKPLGQHWVHQVSTIQDHCSGSSSVKWDGSPLYCLQTWWAQGVWLPRDEDLDGKTYRLFYKQGQSRLHSISWGNRTAAKFSNWQMASRKGQADLGEPGKGYCKDSAGGVGQKWEVKESAAVTRA